MNITALPTIGQQTRAIGRPSPLTRVMAWEFRRFLASRLFWFQALGFFGFSTSLAQRVIQIPPAECWNLHLSCAFSR